MTIVSKLGVMVLGASSMVFAAEIGTRSTAAQLDLLIYVDDAIDPASFDAIQPELDRFIRALPETTKVTTDEKRVREAGTYSNLLKLMRTLPSYSQSGRRAVLVISDGVGDGPLVQAVSRNARSSGIEVYTIFVPTPRTNASEEFDDVGQSNLLLLSEATGAQSYHSGIGGENALCSILQDLNERFARPVDGWQSSTVTTP
jgi:hypothetical protein